MAHVTGHVSHVTSHHANSQLTIPLLTSLLGTEGWFTKAEHKTPKKFQNLKKMYKKVKKKWGSYYCNLQMCFSTRSLQHSQLLSPTEGTRYQWILLLIDGIGQSANQYKCKLTKKETLFHFCLYSLG